MERQLLTERSSVQLSAGSSRNNFNFHAKVTNKQYNIIYLFIIDTVHTVHSVKIRKQEGNQHIH